MSVTNCSHPYMVYTPRVTCTQDAHETHTTTFMDMNMHDTSIHVHTTQPFFLNNIYLLMMNHRVWTMFTTIYLQILFLEFRQSAFPSLPSDITNQTDMSLLTKRLHIPRYESSSVFVFSITEHPSKSSTTDTSTTYKRFIRDQTLVVHLHATFLWVVQVCGQCDL